MFKYLPNDALNMQAIQFFTLLRNGRRLKAMDYVENLRIAAVAIQDVKYYEGLRCEYLDRVFVKKPEIKEEITLPEQRKNLRNFMGRV